MSPARAKSQRTASKSKASAKRAVTRRATPAKGRANGSARRASQVVARPKAAAQATNGRRHCAATDPFGDPCQSVPRLPSKYCTIHSYLER